MKRAIRALLFITLLPLHALGWALMLLVKIPTAAAGLIMIPLLYPMRRTRYGALPFWTRPWANPEDWEGPGNGADSLPLWWVKSKGLGFGSFFQYHAIRNPANGLRSFELLDLTIDSNKMRFIRSKNFSERRYAVSAIRRAGLKTVWFYAWQGAQAGFEVVHIWRNDIWGNKRHLNVKWGWRLEPSDKEYPADNLGSRDASFASKILLYRKG